MLAAGEARAVGILQTDAGEVADVRALYECEGWLCNLQGDCFEIGADGNVRLYGQERAAGHALVAQDEAGPIECSKWNAPTTRLELAIALGVGRRALAPSAVEAIVGQYGSLDAIREELDQLSREIRPEDRWRPTGHEEFRKRKARQDELLAVERLLAPPRDPRSAASTPAAGVQVGAHPGTRIPRRGFFRRVGDRLATDAAVAIVGGSLGLVGLRAYTLRMAALNSRQEPSVQEEILRSTVKEVWLTPDLYDLMERTSRNGSGFESDQSLFDYCVQRRFQESWFIIDYEWIVRVANGEPVSRTLLVCRPGREIQHAAFLRLVILARGGKMRLPEDRKIITDFSSIEAFQRIPAAWASQSFETIMKAIHERQDRPKNGDRSGSLMSTFERSPDTASDVGKP